MAFQAGFKIRRRDDEFTSPLQRFYVHRNTREGVAGGGGALAHAAHRFFVYTGSVRARRGPRPPCAPWFSLP